MKQIEGVITQVVDLWKFHNFWMVEVEVLINGDYSRIDIQVSTEREARAIKSGDTVPLPVVGMDGALDDADELPF
ncbi:MULTISPECIES: hypothetical protein [Citrobacter freundii complex]|nr:hypothetical protein [Citrobacter freundii]